MSKAICVVRVCACVCKGVWVPAGGWGLGLAYLGASSWGDLGRPGSQVRATEQTECLKSAIGRIHIVYLCIYIHTFSTNRLHKPKRPLVLFTFVLCFLYMFICVASHVHMYIYKCRNAWSALLLGRSGKMELQQPCLNNLSTNFHAERSVEGMLYPTCPDKKISVQQVQCIRLVICRHCHTSGYCTHTLYLHVNSSRCSLCLQNILCVFNL